MNKKKLIILISVLIALAVLVCVGVFALSSSKANRIEENLDLGEKYLAELEYEKALGEGFKYDPEVVVEQYIKGREFSVGVIGGKALPVIEIAPKEGFYDYKNKYQAGSTVETCPALISEEKTLEMQQIAEKVFKVLRLKNYARMDFLMEEGTEKLYCLEANTLPGMTPTSLLPQEAQAVRMSFEQLCEKIIEISTGSRVEE